MMQCPMISVAFDKYDKVLILTANDDTLKPQKETLLTSCGFDVDDSRFMIKGCQDVPGFDAVAKGEKVDVDYVQPGIVYMVKQILKKNASIRAILLECTERFGRGSQSLPTFEVFFQCYVVSDFN
ncbi:ALMA7 [Symbiodinium necroappetens]|uniref:ALMA7 protein n=1 Tax=Symbiodinium necroappetens TaxID=1628268 RepID=A0A813BWK2_9DINO|nr:ALMA7 [Symbiodinium necroappetens]